MTTVGVSTVSLLLRITLRNEIQRLGENGVKNFRCPFDQLREKKGLKPQDIEAFVNNDLQPLLETYGLPFNSMAPLHMWTKGINEALVRLLDAVYEAIKDGSGVIKGHILESFGLSFNERNQLSLACVNLINSGYNREMVEQGAKIECDSDGDKKLIREINKRLNELAIALAPAAGILVEHAATAERTRVYDAMHLLLDAYVKNVSLKAAEMAPEMVGLALPPMIIGHVEQKLKFNFAFEAGFPISSKQKQVIDRWEKVQSGTTTVKTGEERNWYTLWLIKQDVYENVPNYVDKEIFKLIDIDSAEIPKLSMLHGTILGQGLTKIIKGQDEFVLWMLEQIDHCLETQLKYQNRVVKTYQTRLDEAHTRAEEGLAKDVAAWQPLLEPIEKMQSKLKSFFEKV